MSRSPVIQVQNWLMNNQHLWCGPLVNSDPSLWSEYMEAVQDATDIRLQLNEQLKCLDTRVETQVSLVTELQDFFRKRAEVEMDYSKNLDKLAKGLLQRHKEQKQKREQWHLFSSYACWQHLVSQTKKKAREHALVSDVYSTSVVQRLGQVIDDVQRIYRRCREIGYEIHEELLKLLHELHTAMKTSQTYQAECRQAETKLRYVEAQRAKLEMTVPKEKIEKSKKVKLIEKEIQKRRNKYNDAHLKALKARNEYILCMDAANAAIHKYFIDDLSDIIDCMDFGFHTCIARALLIHVSCEENLKRSLQVSIDGINKGIGNLDSRADKQRYLEANHTAFMIPKKFDVATYQQKIEEGSHELSTSLQLKDELETRYGQLDRRLTSLRTESEEVWKTLETAEKSLMEMISTKDYDMSPLFTTAASDEDKPPPAANSVNKLPEALLMKLRADRAETEDFYLGKFREYVLGSNLMHRLQAKHDLVHRSLAKSGSQLPTSPRLPSSTNQLGNKPRRRRIGRTPLIGQPKLFGGSLEEYLEATNEEIPLIMKSCIRVINLFGLHHQGIFRVSGSQVEINNFREAFERGEDPLSDVTDASDINSVAGVLKLYLRELREPLFPIVFFDQFMETAQLDSKEEFTIRMRDVVHTLPRPVYIVMRYLFYFLNHLSEYSDENMMDPYNLAICFGPTLVPVPEDKEQVQYQNLVNELIKNVIILAEDIFVNDGGVLYERYISREPDEGEVGEAPSEALSEEVDSEVCPSEDDSVFREKDISIQLFGKAETLEAVAQFDFTARSQRELSFKKGDSLTLYTQVSSDWWRGSKAGKDGLIPDKYIMLKIRDEDREKQDLAKAPSSSSTSSSCSSSDELRRRASSSSDPAAGTSGSGQNQKTVVKLPVGPVFVPGDPGTMDEKGSSKGFPSPGLDKRTGRPGVTVALVRPTTLSCSNSSSGNVTSTESPTTPSLPTPTSSISVVVDSSSKEQLQVDETLEQEAGACRRDEEMESLSGSLTLSDEKSLCDSFTSLDTVEFDASVASGGATALDPFNQTRSLQNLDGDLPEPVLRRDAWETRSMTRLNVSVSGWVEPKTEPTHKGSFVRKKELWEKRASVTSLQSQQQMSIIRQKHTPDLVMDLPPSLPASTSPQTNDQRLRRESGESSGSSRASPSSPDMTAAETFASQNQSTLKKTSKTSKATIDNSSAATTATAATTVVAPSSSSGTNLNKSESTSSVKLHIAAFSAAATAQDKPLPKAKPQVLRKPTLPSMNATPSPEPSRRLHSSSFSTSQDASHV